MRTTSKVYLSLLGLATLPAMAVTGLTFARARQTEMKPAAVALVTGKFITPEGIQTNIGSYPNNAIATPDGKYVIITTLGARSRVAVVSADTGQIVGKVDFDGESPLSKRDREGVFYGLALSGNTLFAARGSDDRITALTLGADGTLTRTDRNFVTPSSRTTKDGKGQYRLHVAGLAVSSDGKKLYAANNSLDPNAADFGSSVSVIDTATGSTTATIATPGFPLAIAALTSGANADKKIYVSSEQRGTVIVIDPAAGKTVNAIPVGANASALLLDKTQKRLFVSASGSDTVSIIDTESDKVTKTILLRPADLRGIPAVTPQGMALSPDEKLLMVALSDLNAVAVVDVASGKVTGYIPTGWYPTSVTYLPNGKLFVTNAKGIGERNPNSKPNPAIPGRSQYIQNIIEGTVSLIDVPNAVVNLPRLTAQVMTNNRTGLAKKPDKFSNPGISHVIYIIKENRTYDQVLSDLPKGNNDPSVLLFGRDVTPNQHALAERFVQLDNFYCGAEVSGDGWNMSTQGMVSPYNSRNVVYGYTGKNQPYDYEGTNYGVPVDLYNVPDVSTTQGGYIWDKMAQKKVSFRNFGFFVDNFELPRTSAEVAPKGGENQPDKKALIGNSDPDFAGYDTDYADSEAWVKLGVTPAPKQIVKYGTKSDPARFTAWKRAFDGYVAGKNLPAFQMVRFGRDHTAGTSPGNSSPRAMVADNDFAVGQLVEAVSKSPYWKSTAIFVLEDDAQAGFDHVDAHRSIAFVVSPYIKRGMLDSRFYNTDSVLRTIGLLLGTDPMNHYDASAYPFGVFGSKAENDEPYTALLPAKEIIGEVNASIAYRAQDSARLLSRFKEESGPDEELNDILWHSIKGIKTPKPARTSGVRLESRE